MSSGDEVRLVVPAKPEFLGLARVTAGGLASRLGFTYDQVEDLRLAIDEMCFAITGTEGRDGTIEMRFQLGEDGLTIHGEGHFKSPGLVRRPELSELILDALVDHHSISERANGPRLSLVKKHLAGHAAPRPQPPGEGP